MKKIFISYRRAEAEFAAGALARDLREYFGEEHVFRDKEDIGGGEVWKQQIISTISSDAVMLVLIGIDWLEAKNEQGVRRLDDQEDPIRMEIAGGLARGAKVIPVLLEEAAMPDLADLPPDLRGLTQFNALRLRDGDWQYDLSKILKTLEKIGFVSVLRAEPGLTESSRLHPGMPLKLIVSYILSVLVLLGLYGDDGTADKDTFYGMALLSFIALVLAVFAYQERRSYRRWFSFGAIAFSFILTLYSFGTASTAPEPLTTPNDQSTLDEAAQ